MPRVNLPVTEVTRAGVGPSEVTGDTVNNHELVHSDRAFLVVRNADAGGAHTVTLVIAETVDGQPATNRTVSVPLSVSRYIGPFPKAYVQSDGKVYINVDSTQLRLIALKLP